ncbi:MAG: hypothetical protein V3V60_15900 [Sphingomonas aquatilis]|uniref:hypothetical protein n=1 Tax=Sphingomonas aquatilis TaxID=93063 RepID=UPI002F2E8919
MGRACRRSGWRTTQADAASLATVGEFLRNAGFIGCNADPSRVRSSWDAAGRLRRVHAHYPAGWTCTLNAAADGSYSLSQALRVRVTAQRVSP